MKRKPKPENEKSLIALTASYPAPPPPSSLTMNGTSHQEISVMANRKFSEEIINDTAKIYDFDRLMELKKSDNQKFLAEAEKQINGLWNGKEVLVTHTDLFTVKFQMAIGKILDEVEQSFERKSDYIAWVRSHFGDKHIRYFQQTRQLAGMGEFGDNHASIGKSRLLQFDHLRISLNKPYDEILKEFPFPDTAEDWGGILFEEHIDGIITFQRFKGEGIDCVDFEQAKLVASYEHKAVDLAVVRRLKARLEEADDKEEFIDRFIMDKGAIPIEGKESHSITKESLIKLLAEMDRYRARVDLNDKAWVKTQKQTLSKESKEDLVKTYLFLGDLIKKLGIKPRKIAQRKEKVK